MRTVHSFVAEVFRKLVHTFETTNNKTFQIQFISHTKVKRYIQRIVMRDKRTRRSTTGNRLKNWSFYLHIVLRVEIVAHGLIYFSPFKENIFYSLVHHQIHVALTVTLFRVFECIECHTIFIFYYR